MTANQTPRFLTQPDSYQEATSSSSLDSTPPGISGARGRPRVDSLRRTSISKEEEDWWDKSLMLRGRVKPGPGLLPSGLMKVLHDGEHAPLRVTVTPPDLPPESPRTPSTVNVHRAPLRQEVLEAVPHPHAYFCAHDCGWFLIYPGQGQGLPSLSLDRALCPYPLPDSIIRQRSSNCLHEVTPDKTWDTNNEFKTHHFHRYPSAVKGSALDPPFTSKPVHLSSLEDWHQAPIIGVEPPSDVLGLDDSEEDILLDLLVCCQCQTYVVATPPEVTIPTVISPKLLEDFRQDRLANPAAGRTRPETYYLALEMLLRILENLIWKQRTEHINVDALAKRVGWSRAIQLIFEELGFRYFAYILSDSEAGPNGQLGPPDITGSTSTSSLARAKILRAWVELGILAYDHQQRYAREYRNYITSQKLWVKADSKRDDIQRALGSHPDQMARTEAANPCPLEATDMIAWEILGTTMSTHSAATVEYAYKRQIHCNPLGTVGYFTYLERIRRWANAARDASYPALEYLFITESNRGLWTSEDLKRSAKRLRLIGDNDEIPVPLTPEVITRAWKLRLAEVKAALKALEKRGARGKIKDQLEQERQGLKEAFRIVAESTGDANVKKGYDDATRSYGNTMNAKDAYKAIGVTPDLDDDMLHMVYSMRIHNHPLDEERMKQALMAIAEDRKSDRLKEYAEAEQNVPDPARPELSLVLPQPDIEDHQPIQRIKRTATSQAKNQPLAVATAASLSPQGTDNARLSPVEQTPVSPYGTSTDLSSLVVLVESDRISSGGFADLFLGNHKELGKVAMKRPHVLLSEKSLHRFLREVHLWCKMSHRYILPCLGTCKIGREVYMVSPFIENGDLMTCMQRGMALDRCKLLYEVAEALAHLHHRGIVHGDVKAQNVLLSNDGSALLCDFGLAKAFDTMVTSTESKGAGSVRWMAPELLNGESRTMASDVYSFGITIAEVLSGRPPFDHLIDNVAVMVHILIKNGKPPREPLQSSEGRSYLMLWNTAEKCWVTKPEDRPYMAQVSGMLFPATLQKP